MKKSILFAVVVCLSFLVACSSGGGGLDDPINPYGFVISSYNSTSTPTLTNNDVRALAKPSSASTTMYVGTANGLFSFDSTVLTPVFTKVTDSGLGNQVINNLIPDGDGDMYICTDSGLYKYTATTKAITTVTGFAGKKTLSFTRENSTVFWVGLEDLTASPTSVAKSDSGAVTFYGSGEGMTASSVRNIYVDTNRIIACGTGSAGKGGLFQFDPSAGKFVKQIVNVGLAKGATIFFTVGTTWYAGGPDSGLITSTDSGGTWTQTNLNSCAPVDFDTEIMNFAGNPRYWISTDKGLYLTYDFINFNAYTTGMAGNSTENVVSPSMGSVWAANNGSGGLSRLAFDGN